MLPGSGTIGKIAQFSLRLLLGAGLAAQAAYVGFYFFGITFIFLLDTLSLSFAYWHTMPWLLYGALGLFVIGSIHLLARLFRQGPEKFRKRRLDALASLACIALPGWVNGSLALEGNLTLESHLFYAWFTGFNLLVLCLIAIPRAHGYVFGLGGRE
ncbi:hypothetical protein [Pseudodesulfovibrio pelocollis]|uniref:hypothetical protein n=1 Tax=Pseudodesulfovibrio pelocollis TaxID=3051432 RepID=UPI00255AD160|nr:hypothetical protein [Pseudodesulfovibrio sp. SB368]